MDLSNTCQVQLQPYYPNLPVWPEAVSVDWRDIYSSQCHRPSRDEFSSDAQQPHALGTMLGPVSFPMENTPLSTGLPCQADERPAQWSWDR